MMTDTSEIMDAEIDEVLSSDPDAPYGRFKNGKPRKRPSPAAAIPSVPAPKKIAKPKDPKPPKKGEPDYARLAANCLQLPVLVASTIGQIVQRAGREQLGVALQVDAMTIVVMTDEIAAAAADLAQNDPRTARILEKYGKGGIYGNSIALGAKLMGQFAVNHGRIPPQPALGLVHPQKIVDEATALAGTEVPADAVPDS